MSKDAYYFPHDAGARSDLKMVALRRKHGLEGAGVYWCVVEMLREANEDGYRIRCDKKEDIAYDLRFDVAVLDFMIGEDEDNNLFLTDGEWFWSESLIRRMKPLDEKRRKLSEAGKKGGRPRKKANGKPGFNQDKATPKPTESNKSRVEESREEKKEEASPTFQAADKLCNLFLAEILLENPNSKSKKIESWIADMEKLLRIDSRTIEQVEGVIKWATHNEFWASNVLSPKKLREKFDTLFMQMNREVNPKPTPQPTMPDLKFGIDGEF